MDTLSLARELIRRPSVSPSDAGCQQLIAGLLEGAGFKTEPLRFGEVGNLWARRGRSLSRSMTIRGVQGHVAYPLRADNPMHALAKFVAAMTREPVDSGNEFFPPTTFQMVNVHSDAGAPNVVPGEMQCRFNFRYS